MSTYISNPHVYPVHIETYPRRRPGATPRLTPGRLAARPRELTYQDFFVPEPTASSTADRARREEQASALSA